MTTLYAGLFLSALFAYQEPIENGYNESMTPNDAVLTCGTDYDPIGKRLYDVVYAQASDAIVVGQSVDGHDILAFEYGSGEDVIFILGAIHGDEQSSAELAIAFMDSLAQQLGSYTNTHIVIIPIANPDGLLCNTRTNANKVDLNRNFPTKNWNNEHSDPRKFPGPSAGSEPETQVLIKVLDQYKPNRVISIHAPLEMVNFDGPALELAEKMAAFNGYPVSGDIRGNVGYPGSMGTYVGIERKIPIITLELPQNASFDEYWPGNRDALKAAITYRQ